MVLRIDVYCHCRELSRSRRTAVAEWATILALPLMALTLAWTIRQAPPSCRGEPLRQVGWPAAWSSAPSTTANGKMKASDEHHCRAAWDSATACGRCACGCPRADDNRLSRTCTQFANHSQTTRIRRAWRLELCRERVEWTSAAGSLSPTVWMAVTFGSRFGLSVSSRPAERRLWMNVCVVMMACALLPQGCSGSLPRWSARRQGCSQRCWPTL